MERLKSQQQVWRFTLVERFRERGVTFWKCICECGVSLNVRDASLKNGHSKSCGCSRLKPNGLSKLPEYRIWQAMKDRCLNPNSTGFYKYGARNITVCERWLKFEHFYKDIGSRPTTNHTLERVDVNGNYEPSNCRWATNLEQVRNRRNTIKVEFKGKTEVLSKLCEEFNQNTTTVANRIKRGWSVESALSAPTNGYQKHSEVQRWK